jgi:hypothetical protein
LEFIKTAEGADNLEGSEDFRLTAVGAKKALRAQREIGF